jgi:hypothetical protein
MPTHLLLEGADIESVLSQLRDSHGPDAKIVQAELVRSGGFAGFFAKRRYEVTVEVDEDQLAGPSTPAVSAMLPTTPASAGSYGIDALLSAAEDGDRALIGAAATVDSATTVTAAMPAAMPAATPSATPAATPAGPGWHRPVSTEGNAFSDVLDSLTKSLAEQQRDPEPPFEPFAAYGIPRPRVDPPEPTGAIDEADEGNPIDSLTQLDQLTQLDPLTQVDQLDTVSPARPFVAAVAAVPLVPAVPPVPAIPAEIAKAVKASASAKKPVVDLAPTRQELAALGVPSPLLEQLSSPEPVLALWDVVGTLAEPKLPTLRASATRGGALVVVVGSWTAARAAVDGLVAESGLERTAVFAVGASAGDEIPADRTVRSHAAAVDLVRTSRQTQAVTLLVVDPGQGMHSAARVAQLVVTLEPQFVLVASDAGEELGIGLTALDALHEAGVVVDAIALDGVARAERPAAIFEVPIPVSWIDGRVATPGSWIGLLMDTLTTRREQRTTRTGHRC